MALSNWDTLALDEKMQSINGSIKSKEGVGISIYKNWLYVHDEKAWSKSSGYTKPTIMEVWEGNIRYKDTVIVAIRGPQNGIYCIVTTPPYRGGEKAQMMVGIGCYGFNNSGYESKWVGVSHESVTFMEKWLKSDQVTNNYLFDHDYQQIIKTLSFDSALRFNQGDAYMFESLGYENVMATKVDKSEDPMLLQVLKTKK